mmetsp:Transcript_22220/g.48240  ORF Transcript_22220/g.48240 Transcript_22220/m.48240 type:complete len:213 (-) Transcript_22220:247-885(-)
MFGGIILIIILRLALFLLRALQIGPGTTTTAQRNGGGRRMMTMLHRLLDPRLVSWFVVYPHVLERGHERFDEQLVIVAARINARLLGKTLLQQQREVVQWGGGGGHAGIVVIIILMVGMRIGVRRMLKLQKIIVQGFGHGGERRIVPGPHLIEFALPNDDGRTMIVVGLIILLLDKFLHQTRLAGTGRAAQKHDAGGGGGRRIIRQDVVRIP